jgi:ubiquinone/menaquinone biosynthesis C-methylase UbiE
MVNLQVSNTWDQASTAYDLLCTSLSERIANRALQKLGVGPDDDFLDVAAGSGAVTLAAARLGAKVTSVDFSPRMLERLTANCRRRNLEGVTTAVMDGQALEIADGSFDSAASAFGLTFFSDLAKGCSELHRVLRPGGRAGVLADGLASEDPFAKMFGNALVEVLGELEGGGEIPIAQRLAQPGALEGYLSGAGFDQVEVETIIFDWPIPSFPEFWAGVRDGLPTIKPLFDMLGQQKFDEVGQAFERMLQQDAKGVAHVDLAVVIGTGRKPPS